MINKHNAKHLKKIGEELMSIAWHRIRWWDCCLPEEDEKRVEPILTDKVAKI